MMTTTYPQVEVSPVDALWTLIQGQTKAVRAALTKRLVEQEKAESKREQRELAQTLPSVSSLDEVKASLAAKAADAKLFTQKIKALENDSEGFFKLGGFMADSSSSADELLEEVLTDKYGIWYIRGISDTEYKDLEDSCQYQVAQKVNCEALVSFNISDYKESTNGQFKIYTPQQFIDQELTEWLIQCYPPYAPAD